MDDNKSGVFPWWRSKHWCERRIVENMNKEDLWFTLNFSQSAKQWYYFIFQKKNTANND